MVGLNLVDLGRPNPKRQIYDEEVKQLKNTKQNKRKYNFDFLLTRPRGQKNMGMELNEESVFGRCEL